MGKGSTKVLGVLVVLAGLLFAAFLGWRSWTASRASAHAIASASLNSDDPHLLLAEADRLYWLFNSGKAQPFYAKAERLFAQAGDQRNALYASFGRIRGQAETMSMSFVDISRYLAEQLETPLVRDDPKLKLWCLVAKGYTDLEIDASSAKKVWEEARALAHKLGEEDWESRASGELAILAFLDGDGSKAVRLIGKAVFTAMASGDVGAEIRYLSIIGHGLNELKRYDEAIGFFDRAIRRASSTKDAGFPFMAYEGKASALAVLSRKNEARDLLREGLAEARRQEKRGHETQLLILLGQLSLGLNEIPQAIEYLETAAVLGRDLHFYRMVSQCMHELANIYRKTGDLGKAEARLAEGIEASRRVGDKFFLPRDLSALAELKLRQGRLGEAEALYEKAEDVIDGILVNSPGPYAKSSTASAMSEIYLGHFMLAMEHERDVAKAFQIVERVRGRTAADALRNRVAQVSPRPTNGEPQQAEIANLQLRLMRAETSDERKQLLERLLEAEGKLSYMKGAAAPYRSEVTEKPIALEDFRQGLRPDELVLEYVLNEPRSYCLSISRDNVEILPLPAGRSEIEKTVESYLGEVNANRPAANISRELYTLLIDPIPVEVRKLRLIIVPDGKLNLLPFESLTDQHGRYLLDSHVVTYGPSATALDSLRKSQAFNVAARPFLGVGGVLYSDEPVQVAKTRFAAAVFRSISRGLYDLAGVRLENLPGSRREVVAAGRIMGTSSVLLLGRDATEAAFKSEALQTFKVVHLAVHGVANSKFPERAALVLASDPRLQEDGLLQEREIRGLHLNADLVTLSACDTGVGKLQGQAGVTNLVEAFLFAGANAVIASLWSVDDTYTRALMERFYAHLRAGEEKASALRLAKIDLRKRFADRSSPYYWAGFVIVGEGSTPITF